MIPGRVRTGAVWVLAVPFLVLARPTATLLLAGACLAAMGLCVRAWAVGHLDKGGSLATGGPYAHTRNPLYLGSFLIGVGLTTGGGHWLWPTLFAALFLVLYVPTVREEARELAERFGARYAAYAAAVPAFVPRIGSSGLPDTEPDFRWSRYLRYREWEAVLGVVGVLVVLALKLTLG